MKISVPVNHNYYEESAINEDILCNKFGLSKSIKNVNKIRNTLFSSFFEMKLGDEQIENVQVVNFRRKKNFEDDKERLVIKLYTKENEGETKFFIQTGLYAGVLFHKGCKINITTNYGEALLHRMLSAVSDIYVDSNHVVAEKEENSNYFLFIIAHLFIQSLEKAMVMGLPQYYQTQSERSQKVRGKIDINEYFRKEIPFRGKLTSTYRERIYVQEIVDVLFATLKKLEVTFGKDIYGRLLGTYQLLTQQQSGVYITENIINKAISHRTLYNPVYSAFKKALEYAEIILLNIDLLQSETQKDITTTGYLFDIAELFELYIEKIMSKRFTDWYVDSQVKMPIYQNYFYRKNIYPDLVLRHKDTGKTIVLDAKFKKMSLYGNDVDIADIHQIHSYSAYSNFFNNSLIASGLIYPVSNEKDKPLPSHATLYGNENSNIKFIIDGIEVNNTADMGELIKKENDFLDRVSKIMTVSNTIPDSTLSSL